jgi:hypothetical protein
MRLIRKVFFFAVALAAVLAVLSFALPRQVTVSRDITIDAQASTIFPLVNDLRKHTWSPWVQLDPNAKFSYSGPDAGVGQKVRWQSDDDNVGTGSQEITESITDERIETALDFGAQGNATAGFDFEASDRATKVTWRFKTDVGNNPVARWFGLMFDTWIGAEYEKGLTNLKAEVEGQS